MGKTERIYAVLILAAGGATRMGRPKQLLPWKQTTLLGQVIAHAKGLEHVDIHVVLGAQAAKIREAMPVSGIDFVVHSGWQLGLGSSIAIGVRHICQKNPDCKAVLLLLGDQPFLDTVYLRSLVSTFQKSSKGIVATGYGNTPGVPAIFDQMYFKDLMCIQGDVGAKSILKEHSGEVVLLNADGRTTDVDTLVEYERLKSKFNGIS
ncbi:MAG: nucleotidyltransferase family protein [Bacteroidota bacterium]